MGKLTNRKFAVIFLLRIFFSKENRFSEDDSGCWRSWVWVNPNSERKVDVGVHLVGWFRVKRCPGWCFFCEAIPSDVIHFVPWLYPQTFEVTLTKGSRELTIPKRSRSQKAKALLPAGGVWVVPTGEIFVRKECDLSWIWLVNLPSPPTVNLPPPEIAALMIRVSFHPWFPLLCKTGDFRWVRVMEAGQVDVTSHFLVV